MADATIISQVKEIDRVVKAFSTQVKNYVDEMGTELDSLTNAVVGLEGGWSGEYYDNFKKTMLTKISKIRAEAEAGNKLSEELNATAAELTEMLRLLESAGE